MKVYLKALLACTIFVAVAYGFYVGLNTHHFQVAKVNLNLLDNEDPSYLFPKIKADLSPRISNLMGQYIWKVDIERLATVLEKDQRVKELKIKRRWPDEFDIEIRPHSAIANILSDRSDAIYPMAVDGSVFSAMSLEEVTDAPILRGNVFLKDGAVRRLALELLKALPKEGAFSLETVSEISFDKNIGLILALGPDGYEVIMGNEDLQKRISYVSRVVEYLKSENLRDRVIDSRFQKKVVVRPRNAS